MKAKRWILITAFTFLIASASETLPWLWSKLLPAGEISYIGSLKEFEQPCELKLENDVCAKKYVIPHSLIANEKYETFGLGFFLADYLAYCPGASVYEKTKTVSTNLLLDSYKIYKTVDLKSLNCGEKDIIVAAINKRGITQNGQISSNAVIGKDDTVRVFKRSIEFFSVGIYLIVAILLIVSLLVNRFLLNSDAGSKPLGTNGFFIPILGWCFFALFKSGIVEMFWLGVSNLDLLFRFQTGVSVIVHSVPQIVWLVSRKKKLDKKAITLICGLVGIAYLLFCFTPYYVSFLIFFSGLVSLLAIILGARYLSLEIIGFAVFTILQDLKALSIPYLPAVSTSLIYVTIIQVYRTSGAIQSAGFFAEATRWYRAVVNPTREPEIEGVLSSFLDINDVSRVSYLSFQEDGTQILYTSDKSEKNENKIAYLNTVPPVFAQLVSSRSPVYHEAASSEYSLRVFKRDALGDLGKYYSLLPVYLKDRIAGALAISKYDFEPGSEVSKKEKLDIFMDPLVDAIRSTEERRFSLAADERFNTLIENMPTWMTGNEVTDIGGVAEALLDGLTSSFLWSGFFGYMPENSSILEIAASNFDPKKGDLVLKGHQWEMSRENVRGPGPLALYQNRRLLIPNIDWISEIVSEQTRKFFAAAGTKSICVIPIRRMKNGVQSPFGILWLSSSKLGEFDNSFEKSAIFIQETLEKHVYQMYQTVVESSIFGNNIRSDIQERLLRGENPIDRGQGSLIQTDLLGSTKLSESLGEVRWKSFQKRYLDLAISIGKKYSVVPEVFVWDAVYFTTSQVIEPNDLKNITKEMNQQLETVYREFGIEPKGQSSVRVCATYGDITREIRHGSWTVTGLTMASLSKLEQRMKGASFFVGVSDELYLLWQKQNLTDLTMSNDLVRKLVVVML